MCHFLIAAPKAERAQRIYAQLVTGMQFHRFYFDLEQTESPAQSTIIAPGAKLEQLADGCKFTEGPACDAEGNVLFTDQPNDRIMLWSVDGKLSTYMQPCGRSNDQRIFCRSGPGKSFRPGGLRP